MKEDVNKRLIQMYGRWLSEIRTAAPKLLVPEYSNSYCTSIVSKTVELEKCQKRAIFGDKEKT